MMLGDELCKIVLLEHDGAFKDIQEFAHIAGIGVCRKRRLLLVREMLTEMVEPPVVGDCADVIRAFAERRNAERHDVEPHEEVFAELPLAHKRRQVSVRSRDEPHVRFDLLRAANTHEASLFQDAQQHALRP